MDRPFKHGVMLTEWQYYTFTTEYRYFCMLDDLSVTDTNKIDFTFSMIYIQHFQ